MKPTNSNQIFDNTATLYAEGETYCIDFIAQTGKTCSTNQTVKEIRNRYPEKKIEVLPYKEVIRRIEALTLEKLTGPIQEITEEDFEFALNCLPPEKWEQHGDWNAFRMSEYLIGSITMHYIQVKNKFFKAQRKTGKDTYLQILKEIHGH
jgi:hypothetical protein